jgi:hypothetical protein
LRDGDGCKFSILLVLIVILFWMGRDRGKGSKEELKRANESSRYEYSILQTSRELWRVQGLVPPAIGSEEMKVWDKAGRGVKL